MKCNQPNCDLEAEYEYVWPSDGEIKHSCEKHTNAAANILRVFGFGLVPKPISPKSTVSEEPIR